MWFNDSKYLDKKSLIKWNPAVKSENDRKALIKAINENIIDVIATDHAPHTFEEKNNSYLSAPSGGPLVQHALLTLLELEKTNQMNLKQIVKKTSHDVAGVVTSAIDRMNLMEFICLSTQVTDLAPLEINS